MRHTLLGVFIGLVLASVGVFWWQGRAQVEENAPPPPEVAPLTEEPVAEPLLPLADPAGKSGPAPPVASELTKEQKRFFRYDRNRDRIISRTEMLSTRSNAFRKLDKDGNNLLTFEEWAVTTVKRFEGADSNGNGKLTPAEFATTAPKPRKKKPACRC